VTGDTGPTDVADTSQDTGDTGAPDTDAGDASTADGDGGPADTADDADDAGGPQTMWATRSLGDDGALSDLHVVSASEMYAAGAHRVLRYNGRTWAVFGEPTGEPVHAVWSDGEVVVAAGAAGAVATRDISGVIWSVADTGVEADLRGLFARSPDDLWWWRDVGGRVGPRGVRWRAGHPRRGLAWRACPVRGRPLGRRVHRRHLDGTP
jgi:hypothetical protein